MIPPALTAAFEATWPAAGYARFGDVVIGRGEGGGGRVGSARAISPAWRRADLEAAAEQARAWNQPPLIRALDHDTRLTGTLTDLGWRRRTPSVILAIAPERLVDIPIPPVTAFAIWPPLAIQRDIWSAGNIGPGRQAVMQRAAGPRCALLGRIEDRAAGAGFVAVHEGVAMLHALEILPAKRRKGLAGWMVREAAHWAMGQSADRLALAVTRGNSGALALYRKLGFEEIAGYGYWEPAETVKC